MAELLAQGLSGTLHFDGIWVTIERTGFRAKATVGSGEKRLNVATITAVQWKEPTSMVHGYISFTVPGGVESKSRAGRQTRNAAKDENSIVVKKSQAEQFHVVKRAIEDAIAGQYQQPQQSNASYASTTTPPPPPAVAIPAGWYTAPDGACQRYWDGSQWTEHTAPLA